MSMYLKRVSDVMTRDVVCFTPQTPIAEATTALLDQHIGGAPVLENGRLVGILSKSDLCDPRRVGDTVGDRMTPLAFWVRADDAVQTAARLMTFEKIHRAVVVDRAGKVVGIITTSDITRAEAQASREHADPASAVPTEPQS